MVDGGTRHSPCLVRPSSVSCPSSWQRCLSRPRCAAGRPSPPPRVLPGGRVSLPAAGPRLEEIETPTAEGHETEAQTIARCLQDLQSRDIDVRRRAAMVIGKYNTPLAQHAVIGCLADSDDRVRQTALVSISEHRIIPPASRAPVLRMLTDSNVHIRRIASSLAQQVLGMSGLRLGGGGVIRIKGRVTINGVPQTGLTNASRGGLDAQSKAALNQALGDPDVIVRKNVLSLYPWARGVFEEERLAQALTDEDKEIRALALRAVVGTLPPEKAAALVVGLAADPAPAVRKELASGLSRVRPHGAEALYRLGEDPDPDVRTEATLVLARRRDDGSLPLIRKYVVDQGIPADMRTRVVPYLSQWGDEGAEILTQLAAGESMPLKEAAVLALGSVRTEAKPPVSFFLQLLESPSTPLRAAATRALMQRARELTPEMITKLVASRHSDVRKRAIQLAGRLPAEDRADLLMDLLLDDDIGIRCMAIRQVCLQRIPGYRTIMKQSLKDPSVEIQKATVEALLLRRGDPDGPQILQAFLTTCRNADLAEYVRLRLAQSIPRRPAATPVRPAAPAPRTAPVPRKTKP